MPTKTEEVLFQVFNECMIALGNYERLDDRNLVKFMESVSATFITLDREVLDRYKAYLKTAIEYENTRGTFERANALEDLTDLVD
jgi:hypothetical protein